MALTQKQRRFVEEMLIDRDPARAAMRSGLVRGTGRTLMKNPDVRAAVEEAFRRQSGRLEITADRVVAELAHIAFAKLSDAVRIENGSTVVSDSATWSESTHSAVSELSESSGKYGSNLRVKLHDKVQALRLLGERFRLWDGDQDRKSAVTVQIIGADL